MCKDSTISKLDCKPLMVLDGTATAALSYGSHDTDSPSIDWLHYLKGEEGTD